MRDVFILFLLCMLLTACQSHNDFKDGDILFRGKSNGSLSLAIDEVTQTGSDHHFTHMGVVELVDGKVKVWHAAPEKGVICETLDEFCSDGIDSVVIGHFRIKSIPDQSIANALNKARKLEGQPYDYTYVLESEGYYCSEFVYALFEADSIFTMEPMTFINPSTGQFHKGWVEHYEKMGIPVPEGMPGCNPNGMAASSNIEYVRYWPD